MKLRYIIKLSILIYLISSEVSAQIFVNKDLEDGIAYMVDFIISDRFDSLSKTNTDLDLVDTLYLRAVHFHNGAIDEALLTLTFATLPFREMPLHIPFTNIKLGAELPSGPEGILKKKIERLPGQVLIDSPQTKFGDKDKVAHFFGNAFLSYSVSLFNLSKFLSILVELFEDAFKVEGTIDNRDFIANFLGYHFGKRLNDDKNYLPSEAFRLYTFFTLNYCY
ncbi:MAG: hypothetical protein GXO85_00015 [Chlorobi bacterium]|nr:hypothetical protein [Chlorobiota bacterium]